MKFFVIIQRGVIKDVSGTRAAARHVASRLPGAIISERDVKPIKADMLAFIGEVIEGRAPVTEVEDARKGTPFESMVVASVKPDITRLEVAVAGLADFLCNRNPTALPQYLGIVNPKAMVALDELAAKWRPDR